MSPSPNGVIAVFAKPARPGEVKTRLAAAIGARAAAQLARAFFLDTWEALGRLSRVRLVLASSRGGDTPSAYGLDHAELWPQGDGDLGERMERIARRALGEAPWVLLVGADSPGLPATYLEAARAALDTHDAVLGPAADGGYYLLGLRRAEPGLLAGLPWSSPDTFTASRARLVDRGFSVGRCPAWFDVDRPEDLTRLEGALADGGLEAPRTRAALAALGRGQG